MEKFACPFDPDSINIDKLGDGGTITTYACNLAQKFHRLLVEYINGTVNKQDCMQHLRNVWIKSNRSGLTDLIYCS